mmetsp:Transcript_4744/g.9940  ORF Transcript_4744/g.9940 Transcript_4744/m.9940 type:complete len:202 (+) Transcript_4744:1162-1767(+)
MNVHVIVISRACCVLSEKSSRISLIHSLLESIGFIVELSTNVDIAGLGFHGKASKESSFNECVGVFSQNLTIFASAGLRLISIDHKVRRTAFGILLGHERPLKTRRETGTSSSPETRFLYFIDDPVRSLADQILCSVPVSSLHSALEVRAVLAVKVVEDAIGILKSTIHSSHGGNGVAAGRIYRTCCAQEVARQTLHDGYN